MKKITQLLLFCTFLAVGIILDLAPIHVSAGIDKLYHFMGFSLITIFAISTFVSFLGRKSLNAFLLFLLGFGGIFAGISEFLQTFVAVRDCSVNDWVTNLCGIAVVVVFTFLISSKENTTAELNEGQFDFKDLHVAL